MKKTHEKDFAPGEVVMVLADFSGIEAGTKGMITEEYDGGVMVTWARNGKTLEDIAAAPHDEISASRGWLSDGFGRDDLEYLGVQTEKHPTKGKR